MDAPLLLIAGYVVAALWLLAVLVYVRAIAKDVEDLRDSAEVLTEQLAEVTRRLQPPE